jgi:glycosyltransferase involved in cell wall biosynthesis
VTIWIDVEDLYEYARENARPRGIPRLSFELYGELVAARGEAAIRFCRHARSGNTLYEVAWADVCALYVGMGADQGPRRSSAPVLYPSADASKGGLSAAAQRFAERFPGHVRTPLGQSAKHFLEGFRLGLKALKALTLLGPIPPRLAGVDRRGAIDIRKAVRPGDVLLVFGAHWVLPNHNKTISDLKAATGVKVALLIYDVIPLLYPEWCGRFRVKLFSGWLTGMLPISDFLFAISQATANDATSWARQMKLPLAGPVTPIPIGTGFSQAPAPAATAALPAGLTPGGFALFVSTIEARKNHLAAFRIWRRLLAANPPEKVPVLVFAGRRGFLADDLMLQIDNAENLGGKLLVIGELDDAALSALYQGCRFTLFPSLYEGWGLPVTESLGYGKVCLASDRASVPEAGGDFCAYYDPDNLSAATAVFQRALDEPEWIAGLEARIKAEFRPAHWSETAAAVLRGVGA